MFVLLLINDVPLQLVMTSLLPRTKLRPSGVGWYVEPILMFKASVF